MFLGCLAPKIANSTQYNKNIDVPGSTSISHLISSLTTFPNTCPLSPSSPLEADFGPLLQDQAKEKSGFGSMDNLLSSLPRSLSDVGLADAAQS